MANNAAKATEFWVNPDSLPYMWEYGGQFHCFSEYPGGIGYGMMQSIDTGEPNMTNGGVNWQELDIANAPRNAWSLLFAFPSALQYLRADRYGDIVYFACEIYRTALAEYAVQVGSFNLATGQWGAQGTDNFTNPSAATSGFFVTDVKAIGTDDLIICYQTTDIPGGVGSNVCEMYGVRYNAGTWGTPFTIASGAASTFTFFNAHGRLMYEPGSDYIHFIWNQDNGATGPGPTDTNQVVKTRSYRISTGVLSSTSIIETGPAVMRNAGASVAPDQFSFAFNYSGEGFMQFFWNPVSAQEVWYLRAALNTATPTFNTGIITTTIYGYDCNARLLTNSAGTLIYVHTPGSDDTLGPPITNINPQIAYREWNGTTWGAETTYYTLANGFDWGGRTSNNLPVPDAGTDQAYDYYDIRAIGTADNDFNLAVVSSSLAVGGFCCLALVEWARRLTIYSSAATYFFREPSATPSGGTENVMFIGIAGM